MARTKKEEAPAEVASKKKPVKRRNYKKELEQAQIELTELKGRLLRVAAEFDNYRKRVDREMSQIRMNAKAELIAQLLPILDDLERSIAAAENNGDAASLLQGIKLVHKSFVKTLQYQGVKPIKSVGEPFDPEKHDALMQKEVKGQKPDIVVEEHLKGYEFNDKVIRHAKVIVSK